RRAILAGGNTYQYPIGSGADYAPVTMQFLAGTNSGNLTGFTTGGDHVDIGSSTMQPPLTVNRTWTFAANAGLGTVNFNGTFNWAGGDPHPGFDVATAIGGRHTGSWTYPTVGTRTGI